MLNISSSDIDECTDDMDNCSPNATCNNQIGTFECVCKDGFRGNGTNCGLSYSIMCTYLLYIKISGYVKIH